MIRNERENEMKNTIPQIQTYQGSLVHVVRFSRYWNEATVYFVTPTGKQSTGIFTVGLPRLKKLGKKVWIGLDKSNKLVYNTSMLNEKKTLKENEMKNFIFCIKEIALMFALISMVILAAFGGTAILLSNL